MAFTVHVENFQSLLDVTVPVKGFTVVTGTNNAGKSALMRAIRAAFQNGRGTGFIRHGKTKAIVEITFDDGRSLRWEKGKAAGDKPTYILDGGKPIHPGQAVPDEVRALGVKPIMIGGREIWPQFAPQFTGQIFLLDQPGSVLAEAVSDVNHVSQLNDALRFAESDKRSAAAELKVRLVDQVALDVVVKRYEGLDAVDAIVVAIETDHAKAVKIGNVIQVATIMKNRLDTAKNAVSFLEGVEGIDIPDAEVKKSQDLLNDVEVFTKLQSRMAVAQAAVDKLTGLPDIEDLDADDVNGVWDTMTSMVGLNDLWIKAKDLVKTLEDDMIKMETSVEDVLYDITQILGDLGECPTCGSIHAGGHS